MKRFALCCTILITCITGFSQAVVTSIDYNKDGVGFSFPLVTLPDKAITQKINDYLQIKELLTTTKKTKKANLFDFTKYISGDVVSQSGNTSIAYTIIQNNPSLLSLELTKEWMGAYPSNGSDYYNFNLQNGEIILAEDLFTPAGLKTVKQIIIAQRRRLIEEALSDMKKDSSSEEDLEYAKETFSNCNQEADEQYFALQTDGIFFYKPNCFPHVSAALGADLSIKIPYSLVSTYLSGFGKKVLLQKGSVIKSDIFHSLKKPLYGTIDNKYKIVMQLYFYGETSISGIYYYTSQGIGIEISGSVTGKDIELSENNKEGEKMAVFTGVINNSTITGTWKDLKTGKELPFTVNN